MNVYILSKRNLLNGLREMSNNSYKNKDKKKDYLETEKNKGTAKS